MRLLNVHTRKLHEFSPDDVPLYAILSHTWCSNEEVSYAEFITSARPEKSGYEKIHNAAEITRNQGLSYIWIDTCCIDKTSSAELSEAINSMFGWYRDAAICYAFLSDLADTQVGQSGVDCEFELSRWWSRGWTLQELIAPSVVVFYNKEWKNVGTKTSLAGQIARLTGINESILNGEMEVESASIAKRMSWAAGRRTTRPEDEAYCLMGLFDVNMPMLYGEGNKAFIRLQEAIMQHSDDQSIFAWTNDLLSSSTRVGLLAESPACFRDSSNVVPFIDSSANEPFSVSNKGLGIDLYLDHVWARRYFKASLCCRESHNVNKCICIYVEKQMLNRYTRVLPNAKLQVQHRGKLERLYIPQRPKPISKTHTAYIELRNGPSPHEYRVAAVLPVRRDQQSLARRESTASWIPISEPFRWVLDEEPGSLTGIIVFKHLATGQWLSVSLGSTWESGLVFDANLEKSKPKSLGELEVRRREKEHQARLANTSFVLDPGHLVIVGLEWQHQPWGILCFVDIKLETLPRGK